MYRMGWDTMLTFTAYGDKFRLYRRLIHQFFNPNAAKQFRSIQRKAALQFLDNIVVSPEEFMKHCQR